MGPLDIDLDLVIQMGLLLAAYVTIFMGVFGNWKRKQQDALTSLQTTFDKEVEEIKASQVRASDHLSNHHKEDVNALRLQLAEERADRVEKTARLHARIDEMQNDMIGDLRADMSEIKGKLDATNNIMNIVQQWFVNQNKLGS